MGVNNVRIQIVASWCINNIIAVTDQTEGVIDFEKVLMLSTNMIRNGNED